MARVSTHYITSVFEKYRARKAPPSPDEMQAKVDELIAEQVEAGNLTEEQAAELSDLFEETFAQGPKGPGGPPPSGGSESSDMLADFLEKLQNQSGSASYGGDGSSTSTSTASLLFDISA